MATTNQGPLGPVTTETVTTTDLVTRAPAAAPSNAGALYPQGVPEPAGTEAAEEVDAAQGGVNEQGQGVGVDGEIVIWEATFSKRNFIGRGLSRLLLTIAWVALATYTWSMGHENVALLTWLTGAIVLILWVVLAVRVFQAQHSHLYQLTNRRLFLNTGIFNRRRDMMELMRVKDVFTRQQSLMDRLLRLGTVVVVPSERDLPTFYLAGVDDPQEVMDLIWHHARSQRDSESVEVDHF